MRHPIPTLAIAIALCGAVAGCTRKHGAAAIPRRTFVRANVELRSIPDTAPRGDSLRKAALRKYRVTETDLRRFVEVHGRSPEYLAGVWREVSDSVQKRWEATFPSLAERRAAAGDRSVGAIPGLEGSTTPGAPGAPPLHKPPIVHGVAPRQPPIPAREPPPRPTDVPPPPTERPRPMVRPPPAGLPPDARGPTTVPLRRPVPVDTTPSPRA